MRSSLLKFSAAIAAASMMASTPAVAAARADNLQASVISPWVALSALGSTVSSATLCSTAAVAASSAQNAAPGCVLPQVDAPPPVVDTSPPVAGGAPVASGGGISLVPILVGLAALIAGLALLAGGGDDDSDTITLPPISPP